MNQIFYNILILAGSLVFVAKGASLASRHAGGLAHLYRISGFLVGFVLVAVISIMPETLIAINSALLGESSFGLGMLMGSNVADLSLIFAIAIFWSGRALKIEQKILKNHIYYPLILLLPILLGLDGYLSRIEGGALILAGVAFCLFSLNSTEGKKLPFANGQGKIQHFIKLLAGMFLLLLGAHYTVDSALILAEKIGVSSTLLGMLVVGLGTTIPELVFAIKSMEKGKDGMAVGDIFGTVMADATIVVGILALISPFSFPIRIVQFTGGFMVCASLILFYFMKTQKIVTRREATILLAFWLIFVFGEVYWLT